MFEAPLFLIAAALGAMVPLILHLMQKKRSEPFEFPTLRFLRVAQNASARNIRMQHILLWLLRTAIMLFLGAAFALPVIRTAGGSLLRRATRDVGIVLDMSYTMLYDLGQETAFDRARKTAITMIEDLQQGDRFFVVLAGKTPRALFPEPMREKQAAIAQLQELKPDYTASYLLPAVDLARSTLREHAGRRQMELHVLTDNRAAAWTVREVRIREDEEKQREVPTFVLSSGVPDPENRTPMEIEIEPVVIFPQGGNRLRVKLAASGKSQETIVQLFINNAEHARTPLRVTSDAGVDTTFVLPPLERGTHIGRIEIPEDNLAVDDTFHFLLRVGESTPTLVVGGERETLFLRAALRAASGGNDAFTRVDRQGLAGVSLDAYGVVMLCDALPLPGEAIDRLERFIREGGLMVVFAGLRASSSDYALLNFLPAQPQGVRDFVGPDARQFLVWEDLTHPVLRDLDAFEAAPNVTVERVLVVDELALGAEVLIRMRNGMPVLLEQRVGLGSVLLFTIGADRFWSNFPLTPFYLPVISQLLDYGRGTRVPDPYVVSDLNRTLESMVPGLPPEAKLVDAAEKSVGVRRVMQESRTISYLEEALSPGIYFRNDGGSKEPVLAVNLDRLDSDLTPFPEDELAELLEHDGVKYATSWEDMEDLLRFHRVGHSLAEPFFWLALILIALEFYYANHLSNKSKSKAGAAVVDITGKVHCVTDAGSKEGGKHADI
jgi:hypothetical protein